MCLTDCIFAEIDAITYEKLLAKENLLQIAVMVNFFKQIPYMANWSNKEVQ